MSKFPMICRDCQDEKEVEGKVGEVPESVCETCGKARQRRFCLGGMPLLNLGFRPESYSNPTDRDIAKFQFTNL